MKKIAFLLPITMTLCAHAASPDQLKKDLAACAQKEGDLVRLDCYDSIAKKNNLLPKPAVEKASGGWSQSTEANPIDDSKTVTLHLPAEKVLGSSNPVALVIRCKSNTTEMYINWFDFLGTEYIDVTTRIGKRTAKTQTWNISTDRKSSFYPRSPIRQLDQMKDEAVISRKQLPTMKTQ